MKKALLFIAVLITSGGFAFAQCVPDASITSPGIYPDTTTNLPSGIAGVFYSSDIQLKVIPDTTALGITVTVNNITINSVTGLPAGFAYTCSPGSCVFPGGSNGCIRLSGTSATPGIYPIIVNVTLNGTIFGFIPISVPSTIVGYKLVLDAPVLPVAIFSASSTTACEDEVIAFADMSTGLPTSWFWSFPGGIPSNSTDQYPEVLYTTPGVYDVELTVTNAVGSDVISLIDYIIVNAKPFAQISPIPAQSFCLGESVLLTANAGVGLTYQWFKYGNELVGETGISLVATTAGNYKVKVTDTAVGCTKRSGIRTVNFNPSPSVAISPLGATTFCKNGSVELEATVSGGASIQWTQGGIDIPGATSMIFEATGSGFYKARAVSSAGCEKSSTGITVNVLPLPNAGVTASGSLNICLGDDVTLSALPAPGNSYQWERNLVSLAGETGTDYVASIAGKYTVFIEAANGCFRRSGVKKVNITCREALSPAITSNSVSVFPNPTSGVANVEMALAEKSNVRIHVYDMTGQEKLSVANSVMESGSYTLKLDMETFPRGIYLVKMSIDDKTTTTRVVVQ